MAEDKIFNVQDQTDCLHDCPTVYDFLKLTDEMIKTIIELDVWRYRSSARGFQN